MKLIESIAPLLDDVLVQVLTDHGTWLEAVVIAAGPGTPNKDGVIAPPTVNVGDRVMLGRLAGKLVFDTGSDRFMLLVNSDIVAKIQEKLEMIRTHTGF
ncbi:Hsp10-like protein [Favolaschia claudopus]|uniref:Hsp10-like protein n=1 Tax=Favolaschia claudopus TaxID=2862362 RepID=A0AAV9ZPX7_9AGAR